MNDDSVHIWGCGLIKEVTDTIIHSLGSESMDGVFICEGVKIALGHLLMAKYIECVLSYDTEELEYLEECFPFLVDISTKISGPAIHDDIISMLKNLYSGDISVENISYDWKRKMIKCNIVLPNA